MFTANPDLRLISTEKMLALVSCKLFEWNGFLCRNCIFLLRMMKIKEIPMPYVLRHWSKNAVPVSSPSMEHPISIGQSQYTNYIIRDIYNYIDWCVNQLVGDIDKLHIYQDKQNKLMQEVDNEPTPSHALCKKDVIGTLLGTSQPDVVSIHAPSGIRNKGYDTGKRMISKREAAILQSAKQKRTCKLCKMPSDHDSRSFLTKVILRSSPDV